jgi:hypothetical protein
MTDSGIWLDKLRIREVMERYMRYNDDGAVDRLLALFEEDAIYQVGGRILRGHAEIRDFLTQNGPFIDGRPLWSDPGQLYKQPRSVHVSSNPVIDVYDDRANAESDFVVISRTVEGRARIDLVGRYRDRLRRSSDGEWRFVSRTGVSVARPGEEGRDNEWQTALDGMSEKERAKLA